LPRTATWFLIVGAKASLPRYTAKRQRRRPTRLCRPTAEGGPGLHEAPKSAELRTRSAQEVAGVQFTFGLSGRHFVVVGAIAAQKRP
jgi:hypothetical protein